MPRPGWTAGLGELVRAYRKYTGLSQRAFAEECGIRESSLVDIETGRRDTPDGFLDTAKSVVDRFDDEVEQVVRQAHKQLTEADPDGMPNGTLHLEVKDTVGHEWQRAVIGRAAVDAGTIIPKLPPLRDAG